MSKIEETSILMTSLPKDELQKVTIYTDGAAKGNPDGPGGYGVVVNILNDEGEVVSVEEYTESFAVTSNNRMELLSVIVALESLKTPSLVDLYSDSGYVVYAFEKMWLIQWINNEWRKTDNSPVKNKDLWDRLVNVLKNHWVNFHWVKGHAGIEQNERCDYLATASASGVEFEKKDGILYPIEGTGNEDGDDVHYTMDKECYRIIIAGSRTFSDYNLMKEKLDPYIKELKKENKKIEIISGMAQGADLLGEKYAMENDILCIRMPAKWAIYGKSAGFRRNECMCRYASFGKGVLFAFWDGESRGTKHMIQISSDAKLELHVVMISENEYGVVDVVHF